MQVCFIVRIPNVVEPGERVTVYEAIEDAAKAVGEPLSLERLLHGQAVKVGQAVADKRCSVQVCRFVPDNV